MLPWLQSYEHDVLRVFSQDWSVKSRGAWRDIPNKLVKHCNLFRINMLCKIKISDIIITYLRIILTLLNLLTLLTYVLYLLYLTYLLHLLNLLYLLTWLTLLTLLTYLTYLTYFTYLLNLLTFLTLLTYLTYFTYLLNLLYLRNFTAVGFLLGGSSSYTSTDKTNKNKYT